MPEPKARQPREVALDDPRATPPALAGQAIACSHNPRASPADALRSVGDLTRHSGGAAPPQAGAGPPWDRIQACMAMPLATPALIERVEPYWAIEKSWSQAARAGSDRPGPS